MHGTHEKHEKPEFQFWWAIYRIIKNQLKLYIAFGKGIKCV